MESRKPLLISADHAMYGGAYNLLKAINLHSKEFKATLMVRQKAPYEALNLIGEEDRAMFPMLHWQEVVLDAFEHVIVIDVAGFIPICKELSKRLKRNVLHTNYNMDLVRFMQTKKFVTWWTGSQFRNNSKRVIPWIEKMEPVQRYAMPDLMRLDAKALPLFQTFDLEPSQARQSEFTVTHAAGNKYLINGEYQKGTDVVERVFNRLNSKQPDIVTNNMQECSYKEAMLAKRRSHVFIDQFNLRIGGIGKAGLESLCYGVPVLASVNNSPDIAAGAVESHYQNCPVVDIKTEQHMFDTIVELYEEPEILAHLSKRCIEWSKVLSYKNTVKYLEETWNLD